MSSRNGTKVITKEVRLSYLHVFAPYASQPGQEAKYSACLMWPKDDEEMNTLVREATQVAVEEGTRTKWGGKTPKSIHLPMRDGDEKDLDTNPEYEGMYFLNCSSKRQPGLIDRHKMEIFDEADLKSGDYAIASINFYPYAASGNNGVGVGLNHLMKKRDGEALGGGFTKAENDFAGEFDDDDDMLD